MICTTFLFHFVFQLCITFNYVSYPCLRLTLLTYSILIFLERVIVTFFLFLLCLYIGPQKFLIVKGE